MKTTTQTLPAPVSPLKRAEGFVARMRAARLRHGDCGGLLETDVLNDHHADVRSSIESASAAATDIDTRTGVLGAAISTAIAPRSPGGQRITPQEGTSLVRLARNLGLTTKHHALHLRSLV